MSSLSVPTAATAATVGEDGARQVPFEVRSADDKFLAAVKKTSELELSELDVCQHKVSFIRYRRLGYRQQIAFHRQFHAKRRQDFCHYHDRL